MERKVLLGVFVVVCLCGSAALALDPMGPPAASLGKGNWCIGGEWAYSDMEVERQVRSDSSGPDRVDVKVHKIYVNMGYGFADNVDVYARAGAGDLDYHKRGNYNFDGQSNFDFIYGLGVKGTIKQSSPDLKWGFLAQYSWGDYDGDLAADGYSGHFILKLDEFQLAAGPTWQASDTVAIYGGPFLHYVRGGIKDRPWSGVTPKPIEEEGWLGGYVGAQVDLCPNCALNAEYMKTDNADAIAIGLVWMQ
jgi:hypothetical protein